MTRFLVDVLHWSPEVCTWHTTDIPDCFDTFEDSTIGTSWSFLCCLSFRFDGSEVVLLLFVKRENLRSYGDMHIQTYVSALYSFGSQVCVQTLNVTAIPSSL